QEIYFIGEETLLAIKAYLNGYDFFHPNEVLMWHYYERDKNIKHWDDDKEWTIKEKKSSAFVKNTLANLSKTSKEIFLDNRNF
ncbi:GlcNAc-transferase family protein, partial [Staphylococcus aureus]